MSDDFRLLSGDLVKPMRIRAVMARNGLAPCNNGRYWSPDTERDVDPLANDEMRTAVRSFMSQLWAVCIAAEAAPSDESTPD